MHFQAQAIACIEVHALADRPLPWMGIPGLIPVRVAAETGTAVDDAWVEFRSSQVRLHVQAKRGLSKNAEFRETLDSFAEMIATSDDHCVLVVDSRSSGTIRDDLVRDLKRLRGGRVDDLHDIGRDVVAAFASHGVQDPAIIGQRMHVVVLDIDYAESGYRQHILGLLGDMLRVQADDENAFDVLTQDAHDMIRDRSAKTTPELVDLLNGRNLQIKSKAPEVKRRAFIHAMAQETSTFPVRAAAASVPIHEAWSEAYVPDEDEGSRMPGSDVAQAIKAYEEWGSRASYHSKLDITRWDQLPRQTVVVGGAGAGKSTLAAKLAHLASAAGRLAMLVSMPEFLRYRNGGRTVEEALAASAAARAGLPETDARRLLPWVDLLILDGLDECDPQRNACAREVVSWGRNHLETRLVATTRPILHDASLLPAWKRVDLLPLQGEHVLEKAEAIIRAVLPDAEAAAASKMLFEEKLEANAAAGLASRSPLLLGFLVALHLNDRDLPPNRLELYRAVIQLAQRRGSGHAGADLDDYSARLAIYAFGWKALEATESGAVPRRQELSDGAAAARAGVSGETVHAARMTVERALLYWSARGIVEKLHAGVDEFIVFTHPSFLEHAAAEWLSLLSQDELEAWIEKHVKSARAREVVLFAGAGERTRDVVRVLLKQDDEVVVNTRPLLAAQILGSRPDTELEEEVREALRQRLVSDVPLVVYEAAEAALGLARSMPGLTIELARPLLDCAHPWTRVAAWRLLLETGRPEAVSTDKLRQILSDLPDYEGPGSGLLVDSLRSDLIRLGARWLSAHEPSRETAELVAQLARGEHITANALIDLVDMLREMGHADLADEASARAQVPMGIDLSRLERELREQFTLTLECIGARGERAPETSLHALGVLTHNFLGRMGIPSIRRLQDTTRLEDLREVMRGVMAGFDIDARELRADLDQAIRLTEEDGWLAARRAVPDVPRELDLERAKAQDLDGARLASALSHPCKEVGMMAARLIDAGCGGEEAIAGLDDALRSGVPHGERLALLLVKAKKQRSEARRLVLSAMQANPAVADGMGVKILAQLAGDDIRQEEVEAMAKSLLVPDQKQARAAAEALLSAPAVVPTRLVEAVEEAWRAWKEAQLLCETCGALFEDGYCAECSSGTTVPLAPLLRLRLASGRVTVDELLAALKGPHISVRDAAQDLLLKSRRLVESLETIEDQDGWEVERFLAKILALPKEDLASSADILLGLARGGRPHLRARVLRALPRLELADATETKGILTAALDDQAPEVRNAATRALRALAGHETPEGFSWPFE